MAEAVAGSGIDISDLPAVNAALNGVSAILLVVGFYFIRRGRRRRHRTFMLAAFGTSTLFLISYLIYHASVGSVPFQGQGWMRPLYFLILFTHVVLAAIIVPLALVTLVWAGRGRFSRHRRIARWTLPVWWYVSVTGVLVYLMLYHLFPSA